MTLTGAFLRSDNTYNHLFYNKSPPLKPALIVLSRGNGKWVHKFDILNKGIAIYLDIDYTYGTIAAISVDYKVDKNSQRPLQYNTRFGRHNYPLYRHEIVLFSL